MPVIRAAPKLNREQRSVASAAKGTVPTVLSDAQIRELRHRPSVFVSGSHDHGRVKLTYELANAAQAKDIAVALKDGINGLDENINECMDYVDVNRVAIARHGEDVVLTLGYDKPTDA